MALSDSVIIQRYEGILRRTPTQAQIDSLKGRFDTVESLDQSLLGGAQLEVFPIVLLYQSSFARIPDAEGLDFWVKKYAAGNFKDLDGIAKEFYASDEWQIVYDNLSAGQIIADLYRNILGREPDADGRSFWLGKWSSGELNLGQIAVRIATSDELTLKFNNGFQRLLVDSANNNGDLDPTDSLLDWVNPGEGHLKTLTTGPDTVSLGFADKAKGHSDANVDGGSQDTYNGNDSIEGTKGGKNVFELSVNGYVTQQGTVRNVDYVNVQAGSSAPTSLQVSNWTGIKQILLDQIKSDFTLHDIQEGSTQININDKTQTAHTITLNYDSDTFGGAANIGVNETFATIKVQTIDTQNKPVEKITLTINDTKNTPSKIADLIGDGTKELVIKQGVDSYKDGKFTIVGALDKTLTKLDANTVESDLDLNISEAGRERITATLGSGNDVLRVGNTLKGNNGTQVWDVLKGGAGEDTLIVRFGGETGNFDNRVQAKITQFETVDVAFNSNRTLDFVNVDDVKNIIVRESSNRIALVGLDSTVTTIDVHGPQAAALHQIAYGTDKVRNDLDLNWHNDSVKNDGVWNTHWLEKGNGRWLFKGDVSDEAGTLAFDNVHELDFTHDGEYDTVFTDRFFDTTDDAWSFDIYNENNQQGVLERLNVVNKGYGDLVLLQETFEQEVYDAAQYPYIENPVTGVPVVVLPPSGSLVGFFQPVPYSGFGGYYLQPFADIGGTNATTHLTFKTENEGSIVLRDVRNAAQLTEFTVDAAASGDIFINSVGFSGVWHGLYNALNKDNPNKFNAALNVNNVNISAKGDTVANVNFLNALLNLSAPNSSNGATISNINLTVTGAGEANLWNLAAGDVGNTQIKFTQGSGGSVGVANWLLANNVREGDSLGQVVATGTGTLVEGSKHSLFPLWDAGYYWDFENQAVPTFDFHGLIGDAVHLDVTNDLSGITFYGTNGADTTNPLLQGNWVGALSSNLNPWSRAEVGGVEVPLSSALVDVGNNGFNANSLFGNDVYNINKAGINFDGGVYATNGQNAAPGNLIDVGRATGDWVIGGLGNDVIYLGGGSDFVYGGAGKNTIWTGVTLSGSGDDAVLKDVSKSTDTNYIVTGKLGENEIHLSNSNDYIFLNRVKAAAGDEVAPNLIYNFTTNKDKLILDINDLEWSLDVEDVRDNGNWTNIVDTAGVDYVTNPNTYYQANYLSGTGNIQASGTGKSVIQLGGSFSSYTDLLQKIQTGGSNQISTIAELAEDKALTIAWHDAQGDLHISLAKVEDSFTHSGSSTTYSYNFSIFEVAELVGVGANNWINFETDVLWTA